MVEGQVRPNHVHDAALLEQLETVPRELFVAPEQMSLAYREGECPIMPGRSLLAPTPFARMAQALNLQPGDHLLVVAGATGYGAAVLSALCAQTVLLEPDAALASRAQSLFAQLNLNKASVVTGTTAGGHQREGGWDAILIEGASADLPAALLAQLAEGGRLIGIVRNGPVGIVTLAEKRKGTISQRALFEMSAPYAPGLEPVAGFTFA